MLLIRPHEGHGLLAKIAGKRSTFAAIMEPTNRVRGDDGIIMKATLYEGGSESFRPDQLFKVTEINQLCYFSIQSPFISTHTDTDILTSP
jgi:hypothetical protein